MTIRHTIAAILATVTLAGCFDSDDERRTLADVDCSGDVCEARWSGTDRWSPVYEIEAMLEMPPAEWPHECAVNTDPERVFCVVADTHGRTACMRDEGEFAVAVAPLCAAEGGAWLHIGLGMAARAD